MPELNWPRALLTMLLALGLFFGAGHLYQNYFKKAPFLEELRNHEAVASAEIIAEGGEDILLVCPEPSFRGLLQELHSSINSKVATAYRNPPGLRITDRRSGKLDQFAAAASPALYEAIRSGAYSDAAEQISGIAASYGLTDLYLTVDADNLYLQARDGDNFLYQVVKLPALQEGENGHA